MIAFAGLLLAALPNVVMITVDDLDVDSFNAAVAANMMPNVKQALIDKGYTFANSFVVDSLCCPSRATALTGQYAHNNGVHGNLPPAGSVTALDGTNTLATWMHSAGYRTAFVGKYLNGYGVFTSQSYIPPGWDDWQAMLDPGVQTAYDHIWNDNGVIVDDRPNGTAWWNYNTDTVWLRAHRPIFAGGPKPLFLWITPPAPHFWYNNRDDLIPVNECPGSGSLGGNMYSFTTLPPARFSGTANALPAPNGPAVNEADISDKPSWMQSYAPMTAMDLDCQQKKYRRRIESLRAVDDLVGIVVAWLDQNGLLTNSDIIFTSDNGYMFEHRLVEKVVAFEESIRVPLIIRTTGNVTPHVENRLVSNLDLAPTIAAWGNATALRDVDGRSLLPVFNGTSTPFWRRLLLIENFIAGTDAPGSLTFPGEFFALRVTEDQNHTPTPRLYVNYSDGEVEFYALDVDLFELVSSPRPSEINQLQPVLNAMKTCTGFNCRYIEAFFNFVP